MTYLINNTELGLAHLPISLDTFLFFLSNEKSNVTLPSIGPSPDFFPDYNALPIGNFYLISY